MKMLLPLDEDRESVCVSFARAPLFLLRDTQTGTDTVLDNPAAAAESGAGLQAAQFVVDTGADALITLRCGENAGQVFQAAGIAVYHAEGSSAAANMDACAAGRLEKLTRFHAGYHGIR